MDVDTLFDLPAHPLIVHGAVVLLPLASLGLVVVAAIARWRRPYAPLVLAFAFAATVTVYLAQQSGEALEDSLRETELIERHADLGATMLPWALGVTLVAALVVAADRFGARVRASPAVVTGVLSALALVAGVGATWRVVQVGHSGAEAVWSGTIVVDDDGGDDDNSGPGGGDG